jgi:hypothetical protein
MCDYSLMMIRNRLAVEGEELVAHRFQSGSTGFVSLLDWNSWRAGRPRFLLRWLAECFLFERQPTPVVCIPPGARLGLECIPKSFQKQFDLEASEDVTFTQKSAEPGGYRDALCFGNGATVLLQALPEGQRVTVLKLSSEKSMEPEHEILLSESYC